MRSRPSRVAASLGLALLIALFITFLVIFTMAMVDVSSAGTPEVVTLTPASAPGTWQTPPIGGATVDRSTCVENVTCDTTVIVLQPGNYTGKALKLSIDWLVPASDYDLYVFRERLDGEAAGISNGPPPGTHEEAPITIDAVLSQPRRFVVHVVASAAGAEIVHGTAALIAAPQARTPVFVPNDLVFCPSVTVAAPGSSRDCEPSLRVDVRGNAYVGGIRGVPAGVDLWRFDLDPTSATFDPQLRAPLYLGQPDAFAPNDTTGGRDGGGDIDIATSFPTSSAQTPIVTVISLAAATISSAASSDRGENFALSPAASTVPADDRQWCEAAGADTVYMYYRAPIPGTALFVQRSTDHGATYPQTALVSPTGTTPGYIDVDHSNGFVYVSHMSSAGLFVSRSTDRGVTWSTATVDNSTSHGHLFDPIKVGDDGTVYAAWSDQHAIFLAHSVDHGDTWSTPCRISGPESSVAMFPWLEAGSDGRVAVVWYGTTSPANSNAADWDVWMAITTNAKSATPSVRLGRVSDHVIHASNLSEGGLQVPTPVTEVSNRNLCDYFQVAIDPLGACVIAFTDDHNDYDGHTYLARQLQGPSLYASANGGTGQLDPIQPLPLPEPDPSQPEVSDFLHDASGGGAQVIPTDNPYDLLSIDYRCETQGVAALLETRMKVSALTPVPPNSFWRVNFAANAPGSTADRGDQFYLLASTDGAGTPSFTFGRAVRDTGGTLLYTSLGAALSGAMSTATNEVVVRLALTSLDPYVTHGPPVRPGSTLVGLRGATGTLNAGTARDITRGGGAVRICSEVLDAGPRAGAAEFGMSPPAPNPGRSGTSFRLTLPHAAWVEVAVFDSQGRRVRTIQAGLLTAGTTRLRWDGRTDAGHDAPSGAYFVRMLAGGQMRSQRLVMVR